MASILNNGVGRAGLLQINPSVELSVTCKHVPRFVSSPNARNGRTFRTTTFPSSAFGSLSQNSKQFSSRIVKLRGRRSRTLQVKSEANAVTDQQALEQGSLETEFELSGPQNDKIEEVMHRLGNEKDKPKYVAFDYGFQASFLRNTPTVPGSVWKLAKENFGREYKALRRNYLYLEMSDVRVDNIKRGPVRTVLAYAGRIALYVIKGVDKFLTLYDGLPEIKDNRTKPVGELEEIRSKLSQLTIDNDAVWAREHMRPPVAAPFIILIPYYVLCSMLDVIFNHRPIQRFWFLETVARMPYFSYISMLHLYETLGWWRSGAEVRKVHFAEEWNEMNHLKIMESLGGDKLWVDRFFAQHAAFFYYWVLNALFLFSPKVAYNFSELLETHAVDTYGTFVDENEELLKSLPPSPAALSYYYGDDLYLFDEFQTARTPESRRPRIDNLYDVFCAIRDDEAEHVKTMIACQRLETNVISPNRRYLHNLRTAARPHLSPHANEQEA